MLKLFRKRKETKELDISKISFKRLNEHYRDKFYAFTCKLTKETMKRWGYLDTPEDITSFIFSENRGYKKQFVGLLEREIVCFGSYYELEGKRAFFEGILVRSDLQRKGIGTHLMNFLEKKALEDGLKEFRLEVFKSNPDAIRFYEKLGYKKNGHSYTSWFMHKTEIEGKKNGKTKESSTSR